MVQVKYCHNNAINSHQSVIFCHFWDDSKGIFRKKCFFYKVVFSPMLYIFSDRLSPSILQLRVRRQSISFVIDQFPNFLLIICAVSKYILCDRLLTQLSQIMGEAPEDILLDRLITQSSLIMGDTSDGLVAEHLCICETKANRNNHITVISKKVNLQN